jgi:hypothetical protein
LAQKVTVKSNHGISIKITLRGISPKIWRRLHVQDAMTLADLHDAIQLAMGWGNCHMHGFEIGREWYGEIGSLEGAKDERRTTLKELVDAGINRFTYTYDFGDNWEHAILIEKTKPKEPVTYPSCVAGTRCCPPDDIGGVWGYVEFLEIMADPYHPEHDESREWLGRDFKPGAFRRAAVNAELKSLFGVARNRRWE